MYTESFFLGSLELNVLLIENSYENYTIKVKEQTIDQESNTLSSSCRKSNST